MHAVCLTFPASSFLSFLPTGYTVFMDRIAAQLLSCGKQTRTLVPSSFSCVCNKPSDLLCERKRTLGKAGKQDSRIRDSQVFYIYLHIHAVYTRTHTHKR